jgi:hypothetical protein
MRTARSPIAWMWIWNFLPVEGRGEPCEGFGLEPRVPPIAGLVEIGLEERGGVRFDDAVGEDLRGRRPQMAARERRSPSRELRDLLRPLEVFTDSDTRMRAGRPPSDFSARP